MARARRTTIGRDPLAAEEAVEVEAEAEAPPPPAVSEPSRSLVVRGRTALAQMTDTTLQLARRGGSSRRRGANGDRGRDAVGGRLEIWGGAFGRRTVPIELFGDERRMGFIVDSAEFIDLETTVAAVTAWPDHTEHRVLAAIGWGWAFGAVAGTAGAIVGGGLRLLHPRSMIFEMRLRDGRNCVGRTDGVTVRALKALALLGAAPAAA
jgi:hypothetical protein